MLNNEIGFCLSCELVAIRKPWALCAMLLLALAVDAKDCAGFIEYQQGNAPILLTAPHGASTKQRLPNLPLRTGINGNSRFVTKADQFTDKVTLGVSRQLQLEGIKPFVVIAGIHRSQIDFNRKPSHAYEALSAKSCYDLYHQKIRQAIDRIREQWGDGLLLDIHGQSKYNYDIIRGTRNKKTITRLIRRSGADVTEGKSGFYQSLRQQGYRVYPKVAQKEDKYYGGFTLLTYGSHHADGLDALQIELGRTIRVDERRRKKIIVDIARAIKVFYNRYYKALKK